MALMFMVVMCVVVVGSPSRVLAGNTESVKVGMPFTGKWAYNALTKAECGSASNQTSHPSCHEVYYDAGHWSVDVYAANDTDVRLRLNNPTGTLAYEFVSVADGSCGNRVVFKIKVDGGYVGQVYLDHLKDEINSTKEISNGGILGKVDQECHVGFAHVHMEFKNIGSSGYSCYYNHSTMSHTAGMSLGDETDIGLLGADGTEASQACSGPQPGSTTTSTSTNHPDGTYLRSEFGSLYVVAGGSPLYVSHYNAVAWPHNVVDTTQAVIDRMPMYPRDGTVLKSHATGHLYVVAGGFAFYVTGLHKIPPYSSLTEVDGGTIGSETRALPADGTVVRDWESKSLYTIVGGAALWVQDPATIGYTGHTDIDGWGITHQLLPYPANGAVFRVGDRVHIAAGGAPMQVNSSDMIPPVSGPIPYVDPYTVTHLMPPYPADGTVIRDNRYGSMYVVVGGWPSAIMGNWQFLPYQSWVGLDGWSIENQLRPFPQDGRFVVGKPSGRVYKIENQQAVYVGDMSQVTSQPIAIDDWSLDNQLLN